MVSFRGAFSASLSPSVTPRSMASSSEPSELLSRLLSDSAGDSSVTQETESKMTELLVYSTRKDRATLKLEKMPDLKCSTCFYPKSGIINKLNKGLRFNLTCQAATRVFILKIIVVFIVFIKVVSERVVRVLAAVRLAAPDRCPG